MAEYVTDEQKAKKPNPYEVAARVFARDYEMLSAADKARLRREEAPSSLGAFWICFNPAKKETAKLSIRRCEALLPLLSFWSQFKPNEGASDYNIGHLLRANKSKVALRRVESLFSARDSQELLDELLTIATLLKGQMIDYGQLYNDIYGFDHWRSDVTRRWARAYFSD